MAVTGHNTLALPKQTRPQGVLTPTVWNELHDMLTLALDALGERPEDFNRDFLMNAVLHQRLALKITHRAMESGNGHAARRLDFLCETHQPRVAQ